MPTAVRVDYIDQHRDGFGVEPICTVLKDAGMTMTSPFGPTVLFPTLGGAEGVGTAARIGDI